MKPTTIIALLLGLVMFLLFIMGLFLFGRVYYEIGYTTTQEEIDIANKCKLENVFKSVECLVTETQVFYQYRDNQGFERMSFEELKAIGGDCDEWSYYYKRMAELMGYNSKVVDIIIEDGLGHTFTTVNSQDGYCTIDHLNYNCLGYKRG